MNIFVIISGNKYRSYLERTSWTEDISEAEIFRNEKGAQSSIRTVKKYLKDRAERIKTIVYGKEKCNYYYTIEDVKSAEEEYQLFVNAEIVEVKIVRL